MSFLLCLSRSSLEWRSSASDCGHGTKRWVYCSRQWVELIYHVNLSTNGHQQIIHKQNLLHSSSVIHTLLSAQNAACSFTESERNVMLSGGTTLRTMDRRRESDVFHRFLHWDLSDQLVSKGSRHTSENSTARLSHREADSSHSSFTYGCR